MEKLSIHNLDLPGITDLLCIRLFWIIWIEQFLEFSILENTSNNTMVCLD